MDCIGCVENERLTAGLLTVACSTVHAELVASDGKQ